MEDTNIVSSTLDENGAEILDQTPVSYPIKFDRPIPLHIRIQQQIIDAMNRMRSQDEFDTPEEADDFDIDDGLEFNSKYEVDFDHIDSVKKSAASKEESAPGDSSDGATQAEPSGEASSDK